MSDERTEPTTTAAVASWALAQNRASDPFLSVYEESEAHRIAHGDDCEVYPSSIGPFLGVLAAATAASRILEVGCGLGYSALWLARGAGSQAHIDTCESDPSHAALARATFERENASPRITVHEGVASETMADLDESYDLIFLDGNPGDYPDYVVHILRLLRLGGALISSNLFLGVHVPNAPYIEAACRYRELILQEARLQTTFLPSGLAVSVRR